jgi:toxoflavin biosynthesis protein ToxD
MEWKRVNARRFPTPMLVSSHDPDDRLAMGLPDRVVDRLPVDPGNCVGEVAGKSPLALAGIVEDESKSVSCRFFSAQLLALLGDPRIKPDMPAMVDIPGAGIYVGLDQRSLDSVLQITDGNGGRRK